MRGRRGVDGVRGCMMCAKALTHYINIQTQTLHNHTTTLRNHQPHEQQHQRAIPSLYLRPNPTPNHDNNNTTHTQDGLPGPRLLGLRHAALPPPLPPHPGRDGRTVSPLHQPRAAGANPRERGRGCVRVFVWVYVVHVKGSDFEIGIGRCHRHALSPIHSDLPPPHHPAVRAGEGAVRGVGQGSGPAGRLEQVRGGVDVVWWCGDCLRACVVRPDCKTY